MRRWMFGLGALVGTTALVMACGVDNDCDFGLCAGSPVGGDGGDADSASPIDATPPGCDPTKEQKEQQACLNEQFAVFVSLLGRPENPGTKEAPVNSVKRALELIGGLKQRIFVCEGTYSERVALSKSVSIYGGLACTGNRWEAPGGRVVFGNLQEPGYALDVVRANGPFELVDVEFQAASGSATSPSSIAARIVGSAGLVLKRVVLKAGDGTEGASGDNGETGIRSPADGKGASGTNGMGGGPNACTCTIGGATAGGAGGGALNGGGSPGTGDAPPTGATDGQGGAGASTNCVTGLGHEGAAGANQASAAVAVKLGEVTNDAWSPGRGINGESGPSGQGGGGGGANNGGGGAGGCGGCGGSGGKGGAGGGASIALLAIDSPIKVIGSTLITAQAGKGGKGGKAGAGGDPGGSGGGGNGVPNNGCAGGPGGRGGDGGHGSGGPGGIAVGILHQGAAPSQEASQVTQTGQQALGGEPAASGANGGPAGKQLPVSTAASL